MKNLLFQNENNFNKNFTNIIEVFKEILKIHISVLYPDLFTTQYKNAK